MKLIYKTYLLVGIVIAAAVVNLFLLYQVQQLGTSESYSIIRAGDLKVKTETVSSLASSIASGNDADRENLKKETDDFDNVLEIFKKGGTIRGESIVTIPNQIDPEYNQVLKTWENYKISANQVQKTSVFDQNAVNSLNYVLEKNGELILTTNSLIKDLEELNRDYNRHKSIANELQELAKRIGQQALLISIGEGEGTQLQLKQDRLSFEIGLRKLLQVPIDGLDYQSVGKEPEDLIPIPRENSESLRELDPLWEAVQLRIQTLEERSLLSPEFDVARKNLEKQKSILLNAIDNFLDAWNRQLNAGEAQQQVIIQVLLAVDVIVFFLVIFVIRQSLNPLEMITSALSRVKEGIYGERIEYNASDEVGQLVNTFNIMSDTIKQKEEEAKKTDLAKDEFLAMITHELKTPLVPIQGYADILLGEHLGKLTDKQKERLRIIKSSSSSLLDIISDLLDAQKLDLGQLRMKKESISIKKTIEKAVTAFNPETERRGIQLNYSSPDTIIIHDPERIGQVLNNLIKNSMIAIHSDKGVIDIDVTENNDNVEISVKDNGVGIPLDKQKDLFKKFYQVDASLTRERGGSGLGLAISKGIVENHGGKIRVESTPNVGTKFIFTLPKNPPLVNQAK